MTDISEVQFHIGQTIHHRTFGYRGVIFDVDPIFMGSDDWYEMMAKSRPPKDQPWYHVLVHDAAHTTYVAQRNLEQDEAAEPVVHPLIDELFVGRKDGSYVLRQSLS